MHFVVASSHLFGVVKFSIEILVRLLRWIFIINISVKYLHECVQLCAKHTYTVYTVQCHTHYTYIHFIYYNKISCFMYYIGLYHVQCAHWKCTNILSYLTTQFSEVATPYQTNQPSNQCRICTIDVPVEILQKYLCAGKYFVTTYCHIMETIAGIILSFSFFLSIHLLKMLQKRLSKIYSMIEKFNVKF